jgi:hypothetical protein
MVADFRHEAVAHAAHNIDHSLITEHLKENFPDLDERVSGMKLIDLNNLHNEPAHVREAVAFYAAFGVTTTEYTPNERERHYAALEYAGYIEKVGERIEHDLHHVG